MSVDAVQMLVLSCADLPAALRFYIDALGLPLVRGDESLAIVRAGPLELALAQERADEAPATAAARSDSITLVFKVSQIEKVVERLRRLGYQADLYEGSPGSRFIAVCDPDGRELQLVERAL